MIDENTQIELKRPLQIFEPQYGQCGRCQYVCTEIPRERVCPVCKGTFQEGYTCWPDPELTELWYDEIEMWNQKRVELAVVVAAMYLESSVFHLIFWGTGWLHPQLNWIGEPVEEYPKKQKQIWDYLNRIKSRKRTKAVLKELFGLTGREMLTRVLGQEKSKAFWENYLNLAEHRNDIVHRGIRSVIHRTNQSVVVSDPKSDEILDWCVRFIPVCWDVFAKLHNEFIHKPMWASKQRESSDA